MNLKLVLPAKLLVDEEVARVRAESTYGAFTVLPRHIDFATILTPGLLSYKPIAGAEEYFAVDEGIFVKVGSDLLVATSNAVHGMDLGELQNLVRAEFQQLNEREERTRLALVRLESDFIRRYLEFQE